MLYLHRSASQLLNRWSVPWLQTSHRAPLKVQDSFEVANESMDIAVTLLERFGGVITAKGLQAKLQPALLPLLDDSRTALRKRTITCLCALLLSAKCVAWCDTASILYGSPSAV